MKYNPTLVNEMCEWIEKNGLTEYGGATFKSFCEKFKIDDMTFYRWMNKAEFADMVSKAKIVFRDSLETKLVESLARAAEGYETVTVKTEYVYTEDGTEIKAKRVEEKKCVAPSIAANIFLITNIAADRWKNKQNQEVTGADGVPLSQAPVQITISETKPSKVEVEKK